MAALLIEKRVIRQASRIGGWSESTATAEFARSLAQATVWPVTVRRPIPGDVIRLNVGTSLRAAGYDVHFHSAQTRTRLQAAATVRVLRVFGDIATCVECAGPIRAAAIDSHRMLAVAVSKMTLMVDVPEGTDTLVVSSVRRTWRLDAELAVQRPLVPVGLTEALGGTLVADGERVRLAGVCPTCGGLGRIQVVQPARSGAVSLARGGMTRDHLRIPGLRPCCRCRGRRTVPVFFSVSACQFATHAMASPTVAKLVAAVPQSADSAGSAGHDPTEDKTLECIAPTFVRIFNAQGRTSVPLPTGASAAMAAICRGPDGSREPEVSHSGNVQNHLNVKQVEACLRKSAHARGIDVQAYLDGRDTDARASCDASEPARENQPPIPAEVKQIRHARHWAADFNRDHPIAQYLERTGPRFVDLPRITLLNDKLACYASQRRAVALGCSDSPIALIQGPPGTGKTTTIVEIILQRVARGERVLVVSQSHQAVANVLERLDAIGGISMLRHAGNQEKLSPVELRYSTQAKRGVCENREAASERFDSTNVLLATCVGVASWKEILQRGRAWIDLVIVDEAGRATILETLIPLLYGRQAILIGDHQQLPPTVPAECRNLCAPDCTDILSARLSAEPRSTDCGEGVLDPGLPRCWLERSLLEFVWRRVLHVPRISLDVQFRMHPEIALFVERLFYPGGLRSGVTAAQRALSFGPFGKPLVLVPTSGYASRFETREGTSYANHLEAQIIARILQEAETGLPGPQDFGIITPYAAQVSAVKTAIHDAGLNIRNARLATEDIASVDRFQGSERDVIIVSFTRSPRPCSCMLDKRANSLLVGCAACGGRGWLGTGLTFACDLRRLTVAISRARKMLILVGDVRALTSRRFQGAAPGGRVIAEFERFVQDRGQVLHVWEHGNFAPRNKDA